MSRSVLLIIILIFAGGNVEVFLPPQSLGQEVERRFYLIVRAVNRLESRRARRLDG